MTDRPIARVLHPTELDPSAALTVLLALAVSLLCLWIVEQATE